MIWIHQCFEWSTIYTGYFAENGVKWLWQWSSILHNHGNEKTNALFMLQFQYNSVLTIPSAVYGVILTIHGIQCLWCCVTAILYVLSAASENYYCTKLEWFAAVCRPRCQFYRKNFECGFGMCHRPTIYLQISV